MPLPDLSIIIPIYNSETTLSRCLDSVLRIQSILIEVILVNDGSTDNSEKICTKYINVDSRIKIFKEDNSGSATARNLGLSNATGNYITFVDSDDYIDDDSLVSFYNYASNNNLEIVYCDFFGGPNNSITTRNYQNHGSSAESCVKAMMVSGMQGYTWNKIYKRAFIEENKLAFIDGADLWEDLGFNIRLFSIAKKIAYAENVCYYHYDCDGNASSLVHNIITESSAKDLLRIKGMISNMDCAIQFLSEKRITNIYSKEILLWKSRLRQYLYRDNRLFLTQFVRTYPETNDIFIERWKKLNPIYRLSSKLLLKGWINQYIFITKIGNKIFNLLH